MNEPPPPPMTPQEARELFIGLVVWSAMIVGPAAGFHWLHRVEREREQKERLAAKGPAR